MILIKEIIQPIDNGRYRLEYSTTKGLVSVSYNGSEESPTFIQTERGAYLLTPHYKVNPEKIHVYLKETDGDNLNFDPPIEINAGDHILYIHHQPIIKKLNP